MDLEEKQEKIMDALSELSWSDEIIPGIMEGFFNNPGDACDKADGEMSKEHIESLFELLEIEK